ncbi:MAG: PKD domain-containing protein [Flavobacteriales bacterium]
MAVLLLPSIALFAQVTANFTADAVSGCAPVLVNFTNTSSNASSYTWDFGNGKGANTLHSSALYAQPGIYTVKLTASGVGVPSVKTVNITVYGPPSADFKANKTALCSNEALNFSDLSIAQSAGITGWFWSFGDGQISNAQNPTH